MEIGVTELLGLELLDLGVQTRPGYFYEGGVGIVEVFLGYGLVIRVVSGRLLLFFN